MLLKWVACVANVYVLCYCMFFAHAIVLISACILTHVILGVDVEFAQRVFLSFFTFA